MTEYENTLKIESDSYYADSDVTVRTWDDGSAWLTISTSNGRMRVSLTMEQLMSLTGAMMSGYAAMKAAAEETEEE